MKLTLQGVSVTVSMSVAGPDTEACQEEDGKSKILIKTKNRGNSMREKDSPQTYQANTGWGHVVWYQVN